MIPPILLAHARSDTFWRDYFFLTTLEETEGGFSKVYEGLDGMTLSFPISPGYQLLLLLAGDLSSTGLNLQGPQGVPQVLGSCDHHMGVRWR